MAKVDFSNLLSTSVDSVKRPPVKPPGTYLGTIAGYKFDTSSKKGTPFVRFEVSGVQPGEDIDQAQLEVDGERIDMAKWKPGFDFYLTADAMFRLKEFIESFNINAGGRSFNEVLPELKGMPVMFTATVHKSSVGNASE